MEHFRGLKAQALAREIRPTTWSGVVFRPVPLQEGEEGEDEDRASLTDEIPPYPDPLGVIEDIDLRATQALYAAGRLTVENPRGQRQQRRNSSSSRGSRGGKEGNGLTKRTRRGSLSQGRSPRRGGGKTAGGSGSSGGDHDDEHADDHSIDDDDNDDGEDEEEEEEEEDVEEHEDEEAAEWEEVEEIDPLTGLSTHPINLFINSPLSTLSIHPISSPYQPCQLNLPYLRS